MIISILGGTGGMGKLFGSFLSTQGHKVYLSGRKSLKVSQKLEQSDVIIISVPSQALNYAVNLLQTVDIKNKLIISLGSCMLHDKKALSSLKTDIVFIHGLFGPQVGSIRAQNIVISGNMAHGLLKPIISNFKKAKAVLTFMTPAEHDKKMAYTQALSQFTSLSLATTIAGSEISKSELKNLATGTFNMNMATIKRIFSQNGELWAHLQLENPYFLDVLQKYENGIKKMKKIIKTKNYSEFIKEYEKVKIFFQ